MWIVSWVFRASELISTYQWLHSMSVLLWMSAQEAELAAQKMLLDIRKDIKVISATSCGVTTLPFMLQSLRIKPQPLPVTVTFTSGHSMGTFSKTWDNSCHIHSLSVRASPCLWHHNQFCVWHGHFLFFKLSLPVLMCPLPVELSFSVYILNSEPRIQIYLLAIWHIIVSSCVYIKTVSR